MPRRRRTATSRPDQVYLHVGAPMSGAAYLRENLAKHRRRLARVGLLYPSSHLGADGGHRDAVLDILGLNAAGQEPATGSWARLAEMTRDWRRGTVLISHELLADATESQVERVVGSFGSSELHVVYAARSLAEQIPLAWQAWVCNGGTPTFGDYVAQLLDHDPRRPSRFFWRSHAVDEVLHRWAAYVPKDRIHLVTAPPGVGRYGVLWDRFAGTVGIDPESYSAAPPRQRRLGLAQTEALRLLNCAIAPTAEPRRLARVHRALDARSGATPMVPVDLMDRVQVEADRMMVAVKDAGYRVVGDIADLVPEPAAFSDERNRWVADPGEVTRALTSAVLALAGLASRQEHHLDAVTDPKGPVGFRRRALRLPRWSSAR